jgi:hypothetical protein
VRWSYSALQDYTTCGQKYYLRRVAEVGQEISLGAVAGKAFHTATETWDLTGEWPDWAEHLVSAIEVEEFHSGVPLSKWRISGRKTAAAPNKEDPDHWINVLGPGLMEQYETWQYTNNLAIVQDLPPDADGRTTGIEYRLAFRVGTVDMVAYVDRIMRDADGNIGVVDIKTGARKQRTAQLPTYIIGLQKTGIPATWGTLYYARKGEHDKPRFYTAWTEHRLTMLYEQAEAMRKQGFYLPSPSEDCSWCSVRDHCDFKL